MQIRRQRKCIVETVSRLIPPTSHPQWRWAVISHFIIIRCACETKWTDAKMRRKLGQSGKINDFSKAKSYSANRIRRRSRKISLQRYTTIIRLYIYTYTYTYTLTAHSLTANTISPQRGFPVICVHFRTVRCGVSGRRGLHRVFSNHVYS